MPIPEDPKKNEETKETNDDTQTQKDVGGTKDDVDILEDLSTADIVTYVGKKTANATNPYFASLLVGAATSVDFLLNQFTEGKGKKNKKKKKKKKNKNKKE